MCGNRVVKVVVVAIASSFGAADGRGGEKKREKKRQRKSNARENREEGRERRRWRAGDRESDLFGRGWDSLVNSDGSLPLKTEECVRKAKAMDVPVMIATGKTRRAVGRTSVLAVELKIRKSRACSFKAR